MNNTILWFIFIAVFEALITIPVIFKMKYKKEMYIEFLKQKDDTSVISDEIIKKLFNIELGGDK